jgi:hypothetical protein
LSLGAIMDKKIIREKLSWYRGKIISDATIIERALGWRLRTYFFPKTNRQASIFYWHIINTSYFGFDKKISLYEKIPYFKNLKQYPKAKEALRFVQRLRNAVAHWELDQKLSDENEIVIYNPSTFEKLKLDDKLMEEFKEYEKFLLKVFGWEQTLAEKYGVVSKK